MDKQEEMEDTVHLHTPRRRVFLRKTMCYFVLLFILGVLMISMVVSCIVIVSIRSLRRSTVGVPVQIGNFKTLAEPEIYKLMSSYFDTQLDTCHSGAVNITQFLLTFDSFDKDEDAILTKAEFIEKTGDKLKFLFDIEDLNADGIITRDEMTNMHSRVDIDDDLTVSKEEFILYHELVRKGMDGKESRLCEEVIQGT